VPFPVKGSFGFVDQDSLDQADFASDTNDIPCGVPLGGGKKGVMGTMVLITLTQTIIKINIEFLFQWF
jgi:hypothetical protein